MGNPSSHCVINDNSVPPTIPSFHYILINSEIRSELFTLDVVMILLIVV